MSIWLQFERADGSLIKGLQDCSVPTGTEKEIIDLDLNHGRIVPGSFSTPETISLKAFSWAQNGDPAYPITGVGFYIDQYYNTPPTYYPDSGKLFCGSSSSEVFGDYEDARGSHTASSDLANILSFGDAGYGVQISLDRGRTYTAFKTGVGDGIDTAIQLKATALDIGTIDGQLDPGDRAVIYIKIGVPPTFNSAQDAGIYLFTLGTIYTYSE